MWYPLVFVPDRGLRCEEGVGVSGTGFVLRRGTLWLQRPEDPWDIDRGLSWTDESCLLTAALGGVGLNFRPRGADSCVPGRDHVHDLRTSTT